LTLTQEEHQKRRNAGIKGGITRKLRLSGNEYDNYKQLSESIVNLRESKSISSIKEMYQNMGMTKSAVDLITKNFKDDDQDDIIDDYDDEVDDVEFQQVLLINDNANIPAGTWVKYEPMESWVKNQLLGGGHFIGLFETAWGKYQERSRIKRDKSRGIRYTKRGREVDQSRSSVDEFGNTKWKNKEKYTPIKSKSKDQFKTDFIKDTTWGTIHNIYYYGSKQKYTTYTDKETGKLVKVQHFNGSEKWMEPEYKELYKDINEWGYREI